MRDFEKNLGFYIDNYDLEKVLYKKSKAWGAKGWLTKEEIMPICLWKSRRPKNLYSRNSDAKIRQVTKKAFNETDEFKKMKILTSLSGVSIPTASAILSMTNPDKYPIIDIRVVQTLQDLGKIKWKTITYRNWIKYIDIVRGIARNGQRTVRDVEKGLFAYNRIKLDKDLQNLYR